MYLVLYKEKIPSDEEVVEWIWKEFYGESIKEGIKNDRKS